MRKTKAKPRGRDLLTRVQADAVVDSIAGIRSATKHNLSEADLDKAISTCFPVTEPGEAAVGTYVLVQERLAVKQLGSILLPDDTRRANQKETSVGRIVSMGQQAFRHRATNDLYHEAPHFKVGDYVRTPRSLSQEIKVGDVVFAYWQDEDIRAVVTDKARICFG